MVETHAFFHRWNRSLHVMQILATSKSYIKQPIRSSPIFLHICTMKFKPNSCMQTVQIINWIWKRNIESKFLVTKVLRFELKFLNFERFSDQYQDSLNIIRFAVLLSIIPLNFIIHFKFFKKCWQNYVGKRKQKINANDNTNSSSIGFSVVQWLTWQLLVSKCIEHRTLACLARRKIYYFLSFLTYCQKLCLSLHCILCWTRSFYSNFFLFSYTTQHTWLVHLQYSI